MIKTAGFPSAPIFTGTVTGVGAAFSGDISARSLACNNNGNGAQTLANFFNSSGGSSAISIVRVGESVAGAYMGFQVQGPGFTPAGNLLPSQGVIYLPGAATGGFLLRLDADSALAFATAGVERFRATSGGFTISSDTLILTTAKTPASAAATGAAGQIAWDADYIYVCVAANTWKRVAIATW